MSGRGIEVGGIHSTFTADAGPAQRALQSLRGTIDQVLSALSMREANPKLNTQTILAQLRQVGTVSAETAKEIRDALNIQKSGQGDPLAGLAAREEAFQAAANAEIATQEHVAQVVEQLHNRRGQLIVAEHAKEREAAEQAAAAEIRAAQEAVAANDASMADRRAAFFGLEDAYTKLRQTKEQNANKSAEEARAAQAAAEIEVQAAHAKMRAEQEYQQLLAKNIKPLSGKMLSAYAGTDAENAKVAREAERVRVAIEESEKAEIKFKEKVAATRREFEEQAAKAREAAAEVQKALAKSTTPLGDRISLTQASRANVETLNLDAIRPATAATEAYGQALGDAKQHMDEMIAAGRPVATILKEQAVAEEEAAVAAKDLSTAAEGTGRNFEAIAYNARLLGVGLSTGLTLPLVGVAKQMLSTGSDFETSFADVKKTVEGTDEQFATLEGNIRSMAQAIPESASNIAEVAALGGQLGISTDALAGFTDVAIRMGVSTNLAADQAADAFARFTNITGGIPEDAGQAVAAFQHVADIIVYLGNKSAATESEITGMALRIAGVGTQIGLTREDILGLSAALSSMGLSAEAGGSAISRVLINMAQAVAQGGDDLTEFAQIAQMTSEQFSTLFKENPAEALTRFVLGLNSVNKAGGNTFQILKDLDLNTIRVRDTTLRAANAHQLLSRYIDMANNSEATRNALMIESNQRFATFASQVQITKNKLAEAAIVMFQNFEPGLLTIVHAGQQAAVMLQHLAESVGRLPAPVQASLVGILGLAAALGPILVAVGFLAPGITAVAAAIGGIGATGLIVGAVLATLGAAIFVVVENWDKLTESAPNVTSTLLVLKNIIVLLGEALFATFLGIGSAVPDILRMLGNMLLALINVVEVVIDSFLTLGKVADDLSTGRPIKAYEDAKAGLSDIKKAGEAAGAAMVDAFGNAKDAGNDFIGTVESVAEALDKLGSKKVNTSNAFTNRSGSKDPTSSSGGGYTPPTGDVQYEYTNYDKLIKKAAELASADLGVKVSAEDAARGVLTLGDGINGAQIDLSDYIIAAANAQVSNENLAHSFDLVAGSGDGVHDRADAIKSQQQVAAGTDPATIYAETARQMADLKDGGIAMAEDIAKAVQSGMLNATYAVKLFTDNGKTQFGEFKSTYETLRDTLEQKKLTLQMQGGDTTEIEGEISAVIGMLQLANQEKAKFEEPTTLGIVSGTYADLNTQFQGASANLQIWKQRAADAKTALDLLNDAHDAGAISDEKYAEEAGKLNWLIERSSAPYSELTQAVIDQQIKTSDYTKALDLLNDKYPEGMRESKEYKDALLDLQTIYDPQLGATKSLGDAFGGLADSMDTAITKLATLFHDAGLISDEQYNIIIGANTTDAEKKIEETKQKAQGFASGAGSNAPGGAGSGQGYQAELGADAQPALTEIGKADEALMNFTGGLGAHGGGGRGPGAGATAAGAGHAYSAGLGVDGADDAVKEVDKVKVHLDTVTTPDHQVHISNNAGVAQNEIDNLRGAIGLLPKDTTLTIHVNTIEAHQAIAGVGGALPMNSPAETGPLSRTPDWNYAFAGAGPAAEKHIERAASLAASFLPMNSPAAQGPLSTVPDWVYAVEEAPPIFAKYGEAAAGEWIAPINRLPDDTQKVFDDADPIDFSWLFSGIDMSAEDAGKQATDTLVGYLEGLNLEDIASGAAQKKIQDDLANLYRIRDIAIEEGAPQEAIDKINADIAGKSAELEAVGKIAGSAVMKGFTSELNAKAAMDKFIENVKTAIDNIDFSGLDFTKKITLKDFLGDLPEKISELQVLRDAAASLGFDDIAAEYQKQIDDLNAQEKILIKLFGTEGVQAFIKNREAEAQAAAEAEKHKKILEEMATRTVDFSTAYAQGGEAFGKFISDTLTNYNTAKAALDFGKLMGFSPEVMKQLQDNFDEAQRLFNQGLGTLQVMLEHGLVTPEVLAQIAMQGGAAFQAWYDSIFGEGSLAAKLKGGLSDEDLKAMYKAGGDAFVAWYDGMFGAGSFEAIKKGWDALTSAQLDELESFKPSLKEMGSQWVNEIVDGITAGRITMSDGLAMITDEAGNMSQDVKFALLDMNNQLRDNLAQALATGNGIPEAQAAWDQYQIFLQVIAAANGETVDQMIADWDRLKKKSEEAKKEYQENTQATEDFMRRQQQANSDAAQRAKAEAQRLVDLRNAWRDAMRQITSLAAFAESATGQSLEKMAQHLQHLLDTADKKVDLHSLHQFAAYAAELNDNIADLIPTLHDGGASLVGDFVDAIANGTLDAKKVLEGLRNTTTDQVEQTVAALSQEAGSLQDEYIKALLAGEDTTEIEKKIKAVGDLLTGLGDKIPAAGAETSADKDLIQKWEDLGHSLTDGLTGGITGGSTAVGVAVHDLFTAAENTALDALDAHSPSEVYRRIGEEIIAIGLQLGLEGGTLGILEQVANLVNSMEDGMDDLPPVAESIAIAAAEQVLAEFNSRLGDAYDTGYAYGSAIAEGIADALAASGGGDPNAGTGGTGPVAVAPPPGTTGAGTGDWTPLTNTTVNVDVDVTAQLDSAEIGAVVETNIMTSVPQPLS